MIFASASESRSRSGPETPPVRGLPGRGWHVRRVLRLVDGARARPALVVLALPDRRVDRITIDPKRMHGLPCIRDTRVTVSAVLGQLAAGQSVEQVLTDYPHLKVEDILAAQSLTDDSVDPVDDRWVRAPLRPPE